MQYALVATWMEPSRGTTGWIVELNDTEAARTQSIIAWLKEHAKQEWGHALSAWTLRAAEDVQLKMPYDLVGFQETVREIALHSRYNETDVPGDFYGATHPDLDGAT